MTVHFSMRKPRFVTALLLATGAATAAQPAAEGFATFVEPSTPCFVSRVDGKKLRPFSGSKHRIPAGARELRVVSNIHGAWGGHALIRHEFQGGKNYRVACRVDDAQRTWKAWLEDSDTGAVVAEAIHLR